MAISTSVSTRPTWLMHALLPALLLASASPAQAHDTWFSALAEPGPTPTLALGTGNRYPVQEIGVGAEYLQQQGCRADTGAESRMRPLRDDAHALVLQAPAAARSCWAQLVPFDITIKPELVAVYLREIQAPRAVHEAWARQQAEGLPWQERYVKHARIDLAYGRTDGLPPQPVPMAMDIVRHTAAGGAQHFTVLREGRPLADQPMELIAERGKLGIWRRTDATGRIEMPSLPPGRWVMRGTLLTPVADQRGHWESGFVTLTFEVLK